MDITTKKNKKTACKEGGVFNAINIAFLVLLSIIMLLPFYNVIIISFANFKAITSHPFYIFPVTVDLSAYKLILGENNFLNSFLISVFVLIAGVFINMFMSVIGAYALSKKNIPGRNVILGFILFTMFFNGGLIPYYLVVKNLGLVNNILVMIIPPAISTFYLIIMKNYFSTLPESIEESAKMDGANDIYILVRIIIPISAPFTATFALFYAVERWNEWWHAFIFINDPLKMPLLIYLRELLINFNDQIGTMGAAIRDSRTKTYMPSVQMAAIVVSSVPIILIYPLLQKHFVRGIMIGSIKG